MALRLARAFDTTPDLWLNLQKNYDLWQAEHSSKEWLRVKPLNNCSTQIYKRTANKHITWLRPHIVFLLLISPVNATTTKGINSTGGTVTLTNFISYRGTKNNGLSTVHLKNKYVSDDISHP
jgi:Plasmid maintenance system antidote protein